MNIIGIIPVRYDSSRLPGKPLKDTLGKTMIQRVWEGAKSSRLLDDLYIATDSDKITRKAGQFGAQVITTPSYCSSGTERASLAAEKLDGEFFLNIQGDEPLIKGKIIDSLCKDIINNPHYNMFTLAQRGITAFNIKEPSLVKIEVDENNVAVDFVRAAPSHLKDRYYKHIGLYGYKRELLLEWDELPQSETQTQRNLEQFKALDNGIEIKVSFIDSSKKLIGVDTPEDLENLINHLKKTKIPTYEKGKN